MPGSVDASSSSLPPIPAWIVPAFYAVSVSSILLPRTPSVLRLAPGAVLAGLLYHVTFGTQGLTSTDYANCAGLIGVLYRWFDFLVLHTPETDFWKVDQDGRRIGSAPGAPWARLKWFSELFLTARGLGWNIQSTKGTPPVTRDRKLFLQRSVIHWIKVYLIRDIRLMLTQTIYQTAPGVRFFDLALGKQVLIAWATAFGGYADIELTYTLFSLVCVGSHLGSPESFPPIMGAFRRDAWSVRQMWGVCWHQMMRRPCGEAGRQVKRLLGLKTGGFASRYTQIGVAFVVSGLMHHLGAVKNRWDDGGTHQMLYFLMQPLAYIFEDLVISIGKQRGIKSSPVVKVIGYAWVFAWFSFSMRYMAAYQPLSWLEEEGLPSVVRPVLKTVSLSK